MEGLQQPQHHRVVHFTVGRATKTKPNRAIWQPQPILGRPEDAVKSVNELGESFFVLS